MQLHARLVLIADEMDCDDIYCADKLLFDALPLAPAKILLLPDETVQNARRAPIDCYHKGESGGGDPHEEDLLACFKVIGFLFVAEQR